MALIRCDLYVLRNEIGSDHLSISTHTCSVPEIATCIYYHSTEYRSKFVCKLANLLFRCEMIIPSDSTVIILVNGKQMIEFYSIITGLVT